MEKKDKSSPLRLTINYYGLNNIIILIYYPIPLINKFQNHLIKVNYFIKINLKLGFYFDRMVKREKWKTAFRYEYGLFEFRVILMGLINTLITFQAIINHILHNLLNNEILVYIDNILIYTKIIKEYDQLILDILERLRRNKLTIAPQKYKWCI